MNNVASAQPTVAAKHSTTRGPGVLRRTLAGVVAASAIAFGGVGMLSAQEASAAGVRTQTCVVQTQDVQVSSGTGVAPRSRI